MITRTSRRVAPTLAVLLLVAIAAHAEPEPEPEARARYERGIKLYQQGRFEDAVDEFKVLYERSGSPAILFNLGQCYRQLGDRTSAIAAYRAYLHQLPAAPNRQDVEVRLSELDPLAPPRARPATALASGTPQRLDHGSGRSRGLVIGGVVALGVIGTSFLAAGGAMSLRAASAAESLTGAPPGTPWTDAEATRYDDGRRASGLAIGLYVGGAVALTAGVVTAVLARRRLVRAADVHAGSMSPRPAGLAWAF